MASAVAESKLSHSPLSLNVLHCGELVLFFKLFGNEKCYGLLSSSSMPSKRALRFCKESLSFKWLCPFALTRETAPFLKRGKKKKKIKADIATEFPTDIWGPAAIVFSRVVSVSPDGSIQLGGRLRFPS